MKNALHEKKVRIFLLIWIIFLISHAFERLFSGIICIIQKKFYLCRGIEHELVEIARTEHLHSADCGSAPHRVSSIEDPASTKLLKQYTGGGIPPETEHRCASQATRRVIGEH